MEPMESSIAHLICPDRAFFVQQRGERERRNMSWRGFHVIPMGSDFFKHSPPFHRIRVLYPSGLTSLELYKKKRESPGGLSLVEMKVLLQLYLILLYLLFFPS